jgi:hypothetical protein
MLNLDVQLKVVEWNTGEFHALMRKLGKIPAGDQGEPIPEDAEEEAQEEWEEEKSNPARRASRYMAATYQRTLPFAGWRNR